MNYEEFKHDIKNAPTGGMTPFGQQSINGNQDESLFTNKDGTGAVPSFTNGSKKVKKLVRRRSRVQRKSQIFNKDLEINTSSPDNNFSVVKKGAISTKAPGRSAMNFKM